MRYWPHLFFFGAIVTGIYGFTGVSATAEQAGVARVLFYFCAAVFIPLFVWRWRSLMRGK